MIGTVETVEPTNEMKQDDPNRDGDATRLGLALHEENVARDSEGRCTEDQHDHDQDHGYRRLGSVIPWVRIA